jgi:hypothetical protein
MLKVYDFMGKEVRSLVDTDMAPGEHVVSFDATGLPAGVYYYHIQSNGMQESKKMVIIK